MTAIKDRLLPLGQRAALRQRLCWQPAWVDVCGLDRQDRIEQPRANQLAH